MKKTFLMVATATLALASCSNDEILEEKSDRGLPIDFHVAPAINSRGFDVNSTNLQSIVVSAFLEDNTTHINGETFDKLTGDPENGHYAFANNSHTYYWPAEGNLTFYSYGFEFQKPRLESPEYTSTERIDPEWTMEIASTGITSTFTVADEIRDQTDLVAAYAKGSKKDYGESGVLLDFHHLLSQIEIKAIYNYSSDDNVYQRYDIHIKGVKICNIHGTGDLSFTGGTKNGAVFNTTTQWTNLTNKQTYSKVYDSEDPITLTGSSINLLQNAKVNAGNLMLIPQELTAWDNQNDGKNDAKGAYISVLVRIVNKGSGTVHYPATAPEDATVDAEGYAWTAIPINETWEPGKKYIYTLDFSGGAGYVDPEHPGPEIPGEPTLGGIYCSVAVVDWPETGIENSL